MTTTKKFYIVADVIGLVGAASLVPRFWNKNPWQRTAYTASLITTIGLTVVDVLFDVD